MIVLFFMSMEPVLRLVLGSVLNSIINFNTRPTKIYSYALRKSKLFRKDIPKK